MTAMKVASFRVSDAEVQVLETWLGKQLDAPFQRPYSSQNDSVVTDEAVDPVMQRRG
jgi:hypothetical protein